MKVYRDLVFRALDSAKVASFVAQVRASLPAGWLETAPPPADVVRMMGPGAAVYRFIRQAADALPEAMVVLVYTTGKAEVTNIVATSADFGRIDEDQYNAILDAFSSFALPLAGANGVDVETNAATTDLGPWLSPAAVKKLETFSNAANKSTGSGHPLDAARWYAFLIQAHREGSDLDASTLGRYLVEHLAWSGKRAHDLMLEYELGRALLRAYDAER